MPIGSASIPFPPGTYPGIACKEYGQDGVWETVPISKDHPEYGTMPHCRTTSSGTSTHVTDIYIKAIEVTQAIQCLDQSEGCKDCPDNSLPLTSGKPTAVRVYIGHKGGSGKSGDIILKDVNVEIRPSVIYDAGGEDIMETWPPYRQSYNVPFSNDLNELRRAKWGSATFTLTDQASIKHKKLIVTAEVSSNKISDTDLSNNIKTVELSYVARDPLVINYIFIYYNPDGYIGNKWPETKDLNFVSNLMEKTFPIPIKYNNVPGMRWLVYGNYPEIGYECNCEKCPALFGYTCSNHLACIFEINRRLSSYYHEMNPKPDVLIGWLPAGANGDGKFVLYGWSSRDVGVVINKNENHGPSNEERLAHEVLEALNLAIGGAQGPHDHSPIREVGFDVIAGEPIPSTSNDITAGGDWISPETWNNIIKVS